MMQEWRFGKETGEHESGLRVRFEPKPHGTRGKDVAFQDEHGKRWIVKAVRVPDGIEPLKLRKLMARGGSAWVNWRMRPRGWR